ncbi:hypothetical protein MTQ01_14895 [Streptomyces sp. XM4193]|uniref:hypothetical protein n=1 Tax=Streptomyces sp. XM4193 TaxID=2929782 RepID=UPI001FFA06F8|nr:hypothetical protein [Streptomyces sp. XM4193]MCK1797284.1 hypothetical protein [Streptomyces sp. XM4193]
MATTSAGPRPRRPRTRSRTPSARSSVRDHSRTSAYRNRRPVQAHTGAQSAPTHSTAAVAATRRAIRAAPAEGGAAGRHRPTVHVADGSQGPAAPPW